MGFSFFSLFAISKTRSGAAATIQEIIGNLSVPHLILIITTILISGILSFFLTKQLAKFSINKFQKVNYSLLAKITLIFLVILVTLISGWKGLLILITSTIAGIYCISLGVRRTNMMGCLLLPVILLYLL